MEYKAKVVAGLLTATCVFSIIALILSAVDVKDVFLPPGTKVKSLAEAHLPSLTWVLANLYSEIFPSFRQSVQLFTKMGTNCRAGWHIEWVCHSFLAYSTYSLFTAENQGNLPASSHRALASVQLVTAMSHFPCSSDTLGLVI